jgi:phosphoglycerate kinase
MKLLQEAKTKNKKVFLRVDFNVPLKQGVITDNNRIKSVIPTIKYLVGEKAKLIIGTHCGRPDGKSSPDTSIAPIAKELQRLLNLKVTMAPGVTGEGVKKVVDALQPGGILVLENLRWDKREEENDTLFAQELAELADIYINDAFAVSHRANASVEAITNYLPSYAGFLLQTEIENLNKVKKPQHPFVLIIGGAKVEDKANMLNKLAPLADKVLIGGEVANTFLKAQGMDISESLFSESMIGLCQKMLKKYKNKIILPSDYVADDINNGFRIVDIGEKTIKSFVDEIKKAKTVFWNGNLGYSEASNSREGTRAIAKAMNESKGITIVAGGNTVGVVKESGFDKNISFISTGGGAALEFLAGEKLPGIEALK